MYSLQWIKSFGKAGLTLFLGKMTEAIKCFLNPKEKRSKCL
jgi:hypothetical protein